MLKNLSDRGKAWGIPGETVDGMDVMAVYKAASRLIERARSGEGPAILECKTYRFEDHSKSTANLVLSYRSKDEIAEWMEKDPISRWSGRLLNEKICTQDEIDKIDETVEKDIEEAVEFAKNSPLPEPEDAFKYMYATKIEGIPQKGW